MTSFSSLSLFLELQLILPMKVKVKGKFRCHRAINSCTNREGKRKSGPDPPGPKTPTLMQSVNLAQVH